MKDHEAADAESGGRAAQQLEDDARDGDLLDAMAALRRQGQPFCAATVVRTEATTSAKAGAKALITSDGAILGHIGGSCVRGAALKAAAEAIDRGEPQLIRVKPRADVTAAVDGDGVPLHRSSCPSGGTVDIFIEPYTRAPAIVIFGDGPAARALARLGRALGYRINPARGGAPIRATARDFVVILTQGQGDRAALREAVASAADYIAMVASSRKARALIEGLRAEGVDAAQLARLKAPAGLDIGAIEPEEIAVSILGEIIQHRRANTAHRTAQPGR